MSLRTLSSRLNVSETECLIAIHRLIDKHFPITEEQEGYRLNIPMVTPSIITKPIEQLGIGHSILALETVASTNTYALDQLPSLDHGTLVLALDQSKGKGRLGREWHVPPGKSVSLSIVLKPTISSDTLTLLTQLTAAALCRSLKAYGDAKIKWPNDILMDGKKVAGILIESHFEQLSLTGVVIGVGINTNLLQEDFSDELKEKASSLRVLSGNVIDPNPLIVDVIRQLNLLYYEWIESKDASLFIDICRKESILINKDVRVYSPDGTHKEARVTDINSFGELMVQYEGQQSPEPLRTLDFSVRGVNGYI